jgi:hypothetical protein
VEIGSFDRYFYFTRNYEKSGGLETEDGKPFRIVIHHEECKNFNFKIKGQWVFEGSNWGKAGL